MSSSNSTVVTMQTRVHKTDGSTTYFYFPEVAARRAAELASQYCSAQCIALDYIEVINDCYDYDSPGILIADWQGRPAVNSQHGVLAMTDQLNIQDDGSIGSQPVTWDGEPLYSPATVKEGLFDADAFEQLPGQLPIEPMPSTYRWTL